MRSGSGEEAGGLAEVLEVLWEQAALTSGWPTVHVYGPDESSVVRAQEALEGIIGPVPQADVIEPWSDDDPEPRWELRVDLPDLDGSRWEEIRRGLPEAQLRPGVREGVRAAEDLGIRQVELLSAGRWEARLYFGEEGALKRDLARGAGGDDALAELEIELAHAVREVDPAVSFRSDRGRDTADPVVHRDTGRFGLQLVFGAECFEGLDGDEVAARRGALLSAVGQVIAERAAHPVVRLAPDLEWDVPLGGFLLHVWIAAPPVASLPLDATVGAQLTPEEGGWSAWWADPSQALDLEVQVVPTVGGAHEALASRLAARFEQVGLAVQGGSPRWLRLDRGWAFCPTWRVPAEDREAMEGLLAALEDPMIATVRVVPGEPVGLGEAWSTAVPSWHWGMSRCLMRVRDGVSDRDRLPEVGDRARGPMDAQVELAAFAALVGEEGAAGLLPGVNGPGRAILDSTGRHGIELSFDPTSFQEARLVPVLRALGGLQHPELAPVAHYAHLADRTVVRLWFRAAEAELPPRWR